ncbi:Sulfate permease-like transporter, MFS superfamily [Bosea sp. LC85]|nr:Sulfate permease-like transporter, MFS superfamily [Bosea sp. LC85]
MVRHLFDQMTSAVQAEAQVEIDCSALAVIDLAGLQLLVSAARTARAAGKRISLRAPSDILNAALARAGISPAQLGDCVLINKA